MNTVKGTPFPPSRAYTQHLEAARERSDNENKPKEEAHCSSTNGPILLPTQKSGNQRRFKESRAYTQHIESARQRSDNENKPEEEAHRSSTNGPTPLPTQNSGNQRRFKETSFNSPPKGVQDSEESEESEEESTIHCTCDDVDCKRVKFNFRSPPPPANPPTFYIPTPPDSPVPESSWSKCRPCIGLNASVLSVIISLAGLVMMSMSHTTTRWMLMYRGEDPPQPIYVGLHMLCVPDVGGQYKDEDGVIISASTCHPRSQFHEYKVEESPILVVVILMLVGAAFAAIGILSTVLFSRFKTISLSKTLISVAYYAISGLCATVGLVIWINMVNTHRKDQVDGMYIIDGDGFYYALYGIVWQFMAALVAGLTYCLKSS